MDKREIEQHNEYLAIQKIQSEYKCNDLLGAMKLCQEYMGIDTRAAYGKVKTICNTEDAP